MAHNAERMYTRNRAINSKNEFSMCNSNFKVLRQKFDNQKVV